MFVLLLDLAVFITKVKNWLLRFKVKKGESLDSLFATFSVEDRYMLNLCDQYLGTSTVRIDNTERRSHFVLPLTAEELTSISHIANQTYRSVHIMEEVVKMFNILEDDGKRIGLSPDTRKNMIANSNRDVGQIAVNMWNNLHSTLLFNISYTNFAIKYCQITTSFGTKKVVEDFYDDLESVLLDAFHVDISAGDFLTFNNLLSNFSVESCVKAGKAGRQFLKASGKTIPLLKAMNSTSVFPRVLCTSYLNKMRQLLQVDDPDSQQAASSTAALLKDESSPTSPTSTPSLSSNPAVVIDPESPPPPPILHTTTTTTSSTTTSSYDHVDILTTVNFFLLSKCSIKEVLGKHSSTLVNLLDDKVLLQLTWTSSVNSTQFVALSSAFTKIILGMALDCVNQYLDSSGQLSVEDILARDDDIAITLVGALDTYFFSMRNVLELSVRNYGYKQWIQQYYGNVKGDGLCGPRSECQALERWLTFQDTGTTDSVSELKDTALFRDVMNGLDHVQQLFKTTSVDELDQVAVFRKATISSNAGEEFHRARTSVKTMLAFKDSASQTVPRAAYASNAQWGYYHFLPYQLRHKEKNSLLPTANLYCIVEKKLVLLSAVHCNFTNGRFSSQALKSLLSHNINYVLAGMHFYPLDIPPVSAQELDKACKHLIMESFVKPVNEVYNLRALLVQTITTSLASLSSDTETPTRVAVLKTSLRSALVNFNTGEPTSASKFTREVNIAEDSPEPSENGRVIYQDTQDALSAYHTILEAAGVVADSKQRESFVAAANLIFTLATTD